MAFTDETHPWKTMLHHTGWCGSGEKSLRVFYPDEDRHCDESYQLSRVQLLDYFKEFLRPAADHGSSRALARLERRCLVIACLDRTARH